MESNYTSMCELILSRDFKLSDCRDEVFIRGNLNFERTEMRVAINLLTLQARWFTNVKMIGISFQKV